MRAIDFIIMIALTMLAHAFRFYRDGTAINIEQAISNVAIQLDDIKRAVFWGAILFVADMIITCTPNLHDKTNTTETTP